MKITKYLKPPPSCCYLRNPAPPKLCRTKPLEIRGIHVANSTKQLVSFAGLNQEIIYNLPFSLLSLVISPSSRAATPIPLSRYQLLLQKCLEAVDFQTSPGFSCFFLRVSQCVWTHPGGWNHHEDRSKKCFVVKPKRSRYCHG